MQHDQIMQQAQQPPEPEDPQVGEVRKALETVQAMKEKKGNRSMQDEAAYKAAVQVVAKNPDIVKQIQSQQ